MLKTLVRLSLARGLRSNFYRNVWGHHFCNTSKQQQSLHHGIVCFSSHANIVGQTTMRVLNVAEKNDASRNLSEIMSRGRYRRREGRSKFNKIYEFDYYLWNQSCNMVMTSVSGHLLEMDFSGSYRKWKSCNPVTLFEAPLYTFCPEKFLGIQQTLEEESRRCAKLIIWTDGDREGENIGFEVIDVCKKANPSLQVYRARFSEITQQAVNRACQNLAVPDQKQSDAVNVRRELDLRIGAAFTRFQTLRLQRVFPEVLADQLISYGSCQFPTLGFVVERYKQAQNFIPEPFWKIIVIHEKKELKVEFSWKRYRLFEHTACLALHHKCIEEPEATVTAVKGKNKSKWRPLPLDTVEMEKLSSRKLQLGAKETMTIAEKLYTQGYISYPRTETNMFPKDINLVDLVRIQTQDPRWGEFASGVLQQGPNPRQGTKTDNAHPPIHPIKIGTELQGNEKKLFEFIVRHFLACVSEDAKGFETTVDINVAEEEFVASGLVILARNYLDVYPYDQWSAKEIPEYAQGERFMPQAIEMVDGQTTAPPLLTEADLIALMDKHGIGTDATHAEHIETIKSRLYVGLNNQRRFVPGELGMGLVEGYDAMGYEMSKPHLRSELEEDLKRICEGTKDPKVVLQEQIQKYKEVFIEAVNNANRIDEALAQFFGAAQEVEPTAMEGMSVMPVMKCPKCRTSDVVVRQKRQGSGFYLSCMAFPQCRASIWLPESVLEVTVQDSVCNHCGPGPVHNLKFKFSRGAFAPFFPDEVVNCVGGCDQNFMDMLGIRPIPKNAGSGQTNVGGNGNGRQTAAAGNRSASDSGYRSSNSSTSSSSSVNRPSVSVNRPSTSSSSINGPSTSSFGGSHNTTATVPLNSRDLNNQGGAVTCSCGKTATLLTVRKEGPNQGRQFYKCPENASQQCNFFQWADGAPPAAPPPQPSRALGTFRTPTLGSNGSSDASTNDVQCMCHLPARLLTVQKEGPNKGRQFYSCSKPREEKCNFFLWADGQENQSHNQSRRIDSDDPGRNERNNNNKKSRTTNSGSGEHRKIKCGICGVQGHNRKSCPMK